MFSDFFMGVQQDLKIALLAPVLCALFRATFIYVHRPHTKRLPNDNKRILHCFSYGFWLGMDLNAYLFLFSLLFISIPGAFFRTLYSIGDELRLALGVLYGIILYTAFIGKMIFYVHFNDIYNPLVRLGKNADKRNLADIFFNQNHGWLILSSYIPFVIASLWLGKLLLLIPSVSLPTFEAAGVQYLVNSAIVVTIIIGFYYFRFGGTLKHGNKPDMDTTPTLVKEDLFLAKAALDDLITLKYIWKKPIQDILNHDDETSAQIICKGLPIQIAEERLLENFKRTAGGARIEKPEKIIFFVGESYTQSMLDDIFSPLHLADRGRNFKSVNHPFTVEHFLPAGMISQPAITSLLAGIFDSNLEINEKSEFWHHTLLTSLPYQMKKLGYKTVLWYGGSLSWASLGNFAKALGFDEMHGGPDICDADAPSTWLGIYDHVFLKRVQELIDAEDDAIPTLHFIYTTSNHGPYTMPLKKLGWNPDEVMPDVSNKLRKNKSLMDNMGTYWYSDYAMFDFLDEMKAKYPSSLFVITGDHARMVYDYEGHLIPRREATLREKYATSFMLYHKDLKEEMFKGNTIGGHMNVLPTLIEAIAPHGFTYYSLMESFFEPINQVITPYHWLTKEKIGYFADSVSQDLVSTPYEVSLDHDSHVFEDERSAYMEITGWVARHPETLIKTIY